MLVRREMHNDVLCTSDVSVYILKNIQLLQLNM